jgi:DNA replication protein DnaC
MPCPLCDGTGWKTAEIDGVPRAVRCDCWRASVTDRLMEQARIPPRYHRCDLANFVTYRNEKLLRAVSRARQFAQAFPVVDRGLCLIGPPGIGKTHIAVAVLKEAIRRCGARGLFYETSDLLRVIRNTYSPLIRTAEVEVLQPVMEAELLVLDDLGREKPSEWVEETLNLIINTRYNQRRPTVLTTNYEEAADQTDPNSLLVRIGSRMHSRLYEMCEILEFEGADYRHLPPNGGADDLESMWKMRRSGGQSALPQRSGKSARARLREGQQELGWSGGRAGS